MSNQTLRKVELVIPEDRVQPTLLEAVNILRNVLHHKKVWETHFGSHNRQKLKNWEQRAERFLASLQIEETQPEITHSETQNHHQ